MRSINLDRLDNLPAFEPFRRALHDLNAPRRIDRPRRMKPWRRTRKEEE